MAQFFTANSSPDPADALTSDRSEAIALALADFTSADCTGLELITNPDQVAKLSQDYFSFSPLLAAQLTGKVGDFVVRARSEAEVLRVAQVCVRHRLPLTVRGAGTGNYGQCVPLRGGVILDLSAMQTIHRITPGRAVVDPGVKLAALDKQAQPLGWEVRMAPSTYRTATIGGFVGGGSGGIGSVTYGQLQDRGNLLGLRVVTLEAEPRVLELRGQAVYQVAHAYGTNGIITQLEIPLAPAYEWAEAIAAFPDFASAAQFGQVLADSDGLIKKLVTICADPIPTYFAALQGAIPPGADCALVMVAECSWDPFLELVNELGGHICYHRPARDLGKGPLLMEYTWNHTTLHARSVDPGLTYLQTLFPAGRLDLVLQMQAKFGPEVMMHLEFLRVGGRAVPGALQLVRYSSPERLAEIIRYHEDQGCLIFNPHTPILEDGGMKQINPAQLNFKRQVDPFGLLNPGKMRAWEEQAC
jgi:FAD/FMN-containing dehydrogenase